VLIPGFVTDITILLAPGPTSEKLVELASSECRTGGSHTARTPADEARPSLISVQWPGALGIALMSFTETVAAGQPFARKGEPAPRQRRSCLPQDSPISEAHFSARCRAAAAPRKRQSTSAREPARKLAGMVTEAMTLVTMSFPAPLVAMLPQSALAALVIVYSFGLIKPTECLDILRIRRTDFSWAIVAFAGVGVVGTLKEITSR
jgi:SulP family sulfate permease